MLKNNRKTIIATALIIAIGVLVGGMSASANEEERMEYKNKESIMGTVKIHNITGTLLDEESDFWIHTPLVIQEGVKTPIGNLHEEAIGIEVPKGYRLGDPMVMNYAGEVIKEINGEKRKVIKTTSYPLIQEAVVIYEISGTLIDKDENHWSHTSLILQEGVDSPIGLSFNKNLDFEIKKGYRIGEPKVQSYTEPRIMEINGLDRKVVTEKWYPLVRE